MRRFSHVAEDQEKLTETTTQLEKVQAELSDLNKEHDSVCQQLTDVTRELTDTVSEQICERDTEGLPVLGWGSRPCVMHGTCNDLVAKK